MWRTPALLLACAALAACRGPREYSAPAPAGALDCALREAQDIGYQRMEGGRDRGLIRVSQRVEDPPTIRREQPDPLSGREDVRPIIENRPFENQLLFREDGGRLRIQIVGLTRDGAQIDAGADADSHAQRILAACTT